MRVAARRVDHIDERLRLQVAGFVTPRFDGCSQPVVGRDAGDRRQSRRAFVGELRGALTRIQPGGRSLKNSLTVATALLLFSASAHADALGDLRALLAQLTARDAIRATITVETNSRNDDDEPPEIGKASFDAEHGPQGLRVTYAPELIARAEQEARERQAQPEKTTPTRSGLRRIDPAELIESLDAAGTLARQLDSAVLLTDQRTNAGGRPVRQLTMKITPKLSKSDAKRVKLLEVVLVMNLDDGGIPLSADMRQKLKAKFLLMTFESNTHNSWTFARHGDRLVALRHVEKSTGSGMGQKFENTETITVTPKNGA